MFSYVYTTDTTSFLTSALDLYKATTKVGKHVENGYHFEVELPGVKPEDIDMSVTDNSVLTLKYTKGGKKFEKTYTLQDEKYDLVSAEAKFENGLLELFLPLNKKTANVVKIPLKK
jgi:HSP20 family molecular chaperone IbpA